MKRRLSDSFAAVALALAIGNACAGRSVTVGKPDEGEADADVARLRSATNHHLNRANLTKRREIEKPQILLYERLTDSTYKLNGVEFILPYRLWPRDSVAPTLMGQTPHQEDNLKFWYLHVWAWRENSSGVFANFHPDVKCPDATRKVYTPFPPET